MPNSTLPFTHYLVGGAVRDELLGLTIKDKDWVVTGSTPKELISQGFQQVGKLFPVFLHPISKDEYALARTEVKQGQGYTGFICDFSPDITLEEDLARRDLTINAIAKDSEGKLIDPYHGIEDLEKRVFRHVSDAFIEDPLRVIRVARFSARLNHFGFSIAPETLAFMTEISLSGELESLNQERIWRELEKALTYSNPECFFDCLLKCQALKTIFKELEWQPVAAQIKRSEVDIFKQLDNKHLIWAFLCHKTQPQHLSPLLNRLTCPNQFKHFANLTSEFMHNTELPMSPEQWDFWLAQLNAIKKPQIYDEFVKLLSLLTHTQTKDWQALRQLVVKISPKDIMKLGFKGAELGQAIKEARLNQLKSSNNPLIKQS